MEMAEEEPLAFAQACALEAREKGLAHYGECHESKAVLHTYLAWQDEPGKPVGQSITAEVLKPHTETAAQFAKWLTNLFAAIA